MVATGVQLCEGCAEATRISPSQSKRTRFFRPSISIPIEVEAEVLGRLAKVLCSQCKQKKATFMPTASVPHLFATNKPPLEPEEQILGVHLRDARQELNAVTALIVAGEDQLKRLKKHKTTLTRCVTECSRLLSPVRRLPRDVLVEIAQLAVVENSSERETLDVKRGLWPLTQVCSSWRDAIVNSPMLWSNIDIKDCQPRYAVSILHESIKRSQSVPLDVNFQSKRTELSRLIFQLLCSQSERWRSLSLAIHAGHWPYLSQIQNTLSQLRSLEFNRRGNTSEFSPVQTEGVDFFAFAPKLESVWLGLGHHGGPPPVFFKFPSNPIVNFQVRLLRVLHPHIHSIIPPSATDIYVGTDDPQSGVVLVPSVYPSTLTLRISAASWLLDVFTCPQLNQLVLRTMQLDEEFMNHFLPFVNRSTQGHSFFSLRLFKITVPSSPVVRELFKSVHFITHLAITHVPNDGTQAQHINASRRITRLLTPLLLTANPSSVFLPSLLNLTIELDAFCPTPQLYTLVHSIVHSRLNPPPGYGGLKLSRFKFVDHQSKEIGAVITQRTYDTLLLRANGQ